MGQGKSTLLQSLTGLNNDVIPALQGKACTAARSTIFHEVGGSTTAEIEFHSKASFLKEVILPYYDKLGLDPKPTSFKEFAHSEIPRLSSPHQTDVNIYNNLRYYHANVERYRDWLERGVYTIHDPSQVANYVSQKYDAQTYRVINYECLAVKHVKIRCPFPSDEIGDIALVDVPGLGDFRLGDEAIAIEALAQEVDFILFIRKPSKDRASLEQNDTQLYDLANQALNDLPSRSLFVLNVDRNRENEINCQSQKRDIESGTVKMPVLECTLADCSSPEEANSKVLQVVLDNLRSNITELDKNYAWNKLQDLQRAIAELKNQLASARDVLPDIDKYELEKKYNKWITQKFWGTLTKELEQLLKQLYSTRDKPDENLKSQIESVIQECQENPPLLTVEDIEGKNYEMGSYFSAYTEYLGEVRTGLSQKFLDIDKGLKKSITDTKEKVVKVLVEKCSLGGLSAARDPEEFLTEEFLTAVASQIPPEYPALKTGLPGRIWNQ